MLSNSRVRPRGAGRVASALLAVGVLTACQPDPPEGKILEVSGDVTLDDEPVAVGPILLDGLQVQMLQSTDIRDPYVYGVETELKWAMGLPGGPLLAERPTIGISYTMRNYDLNAVESIPVPAGALVRPLDTILAFISLLQN